MWDGSDRSKATLMYVHNGQVRTRLISSLGPSIVRSPEVYFDDAPGEQQTIAGERERTKDDDEEQEKKKKKKKKRKRKKKERKKQRNKERKKKRKERRKRQIAAGF